MGRIFEDTLFSHFEVGGGWDPKQYQALLHPSSRPHLAYITSLNVSPGGHRNIIGAGPRKAPVNFGVSAQSTTVGFVGSGAGGVNVEFDKDTVQLQPTMPLGVATRAEAVVIKFGQKAASGRHLITRKADDPDTCFNPATYFLKKVLMDAE